MEPGENCKGKRFKNEILKVKYHKKSIDDILTMTVDEAIIFFSLHENKKISNKLKPLQDVGMGYVQLGQSSSTLSGGEAQRIKLASELSKRDTGNTIYILDEPTTHLDMYHKAYILKLLQKLVKETNKTILFSSHEINLAIQLCDTMIVMTNTEVVSDTPCNLIKQGTFNDLFPKDMIAFDETTGGFRVNK